MKLFNGLINWAIKRRIRDIQLFIDNPIEVQQELLGNLIYTARNTQFGKKFGFGDIENYGQYKSQVPISTYEDLFPFIEKNLKGEQNVLWPSTIKWFAKSSGTTNAKSKYIPVSQEALEECHFKAGKDVYTLFVNNYPETEIFTGKGLAIGGSQQINQFDTQSETHYGDLSAVIMKNLPFWAQFGRTPDLEVALMSEWESKIEKMALQTIKEDVTQLLGVPTWTLILLKRILDITGKKDIREVWPNLELFVHGAVAFEPYEKPFRSLIPYDDMHYVETYNASEGFFGIQDQKNSRDMLLLLDYGIYYEFIPLEHIHDENPKIIDLSEVELNKNYALVISTNGGLWRYMIGDTIKFTSLKPYRTRISGRTKHYINSFGEEVIVDNAEQAIKKACEHTGAIIDNYTAGPKYFEGYSQACHEWIIEFIKYPEDKEKFIAILDEAIKEVNSDYEAKRYKDIALKMPEVHFAEKGTFYNWMKKRGKLGGQNKVPRLANDREYLDDIIEMMALSLK